MQQQFVFVAPQQQQYVFARPPPSDFHPQCRPVVIVQPQQQFCQSPQFRPVVNIQPQQFRPVNIQPQQFRPVNVQPQQFRPVVNIQPQQFRPVQPQQFRPVVNIQPQQQSIRPQQLPQQMSDRFFKSFMSNIQQQICRYTRTPPQPKSDNRIEEIIIDSTSTQTEDDVRISVSTQIDDYRVSTSTQTEDDDRISVSTQIDDCRVSTQTDAVIDLAMDAIKCGDFDFFKWMFSSPFITIIFDESKKRRLMVWASSNGYMDAIDFLHLEGGFPLDGLIGVAVENGHLNVVKGLYFHYDIIASESDVDSAVAYNHFDIVTFFHEHNIICSKNAIVIAAGNGNLKLVKWLHTNSHVNDIASAISCAFKHDHLDVVFFLQTVSNPRLLQKNKDDDHHGSTSSQNENDDHHIDEMQIDVSNTREISSIRHPLDCKSKLLRYIVQVLMDSYMEHAKNIEASAMTCDEIFKRLSRKGVIRNSLNNALHTNAKLRRHIYIVNKEEKKGHRFAMIDWLATM